MQIEQKAAAPAGDDARLAEGLFIPLGADGVVARSGRFEQVVEALGRLITCLGGGVAERLRLPPVMSRAQIERAGYLHGFPHLLGCVSCLEGPEPALRAAGARLERGESWTDALGAADLVLTPAACYPLYPLAAARGPLGGEGLLFDVVADCFRREPSEAADRLQSFRMREFVRLGSAEQTRTFRRRWTEQASALARALGLPFTIDRASDPFFGRGGEMLAANQERLALKFELRVPVRPAAAPTACVSFNDHQTRFALPFGIVGEDGSNCHSACVAFGLDRLALAMFATHGGQLESWPGAVRHALEL